MDRVLVKEPVKMVRYSSGWMVLDSCCACCRQYWSFPFTIESNIISFLTLFFHNSVHIGHIINGCKARLACYKTGYASGAGTDGYVESVVNSCHGDFSCQQISSSHTGRAGSVGDIKDSCHGLASCLLMASTTTSSGNAGTVGNIKDSCHGENSCSYISGSFSVGIAGSVGDITCSCQGDNSCYSLYSGFGRDGGHALSINELSFCCNGVSECDDFLLDNFTLPASCAANDYTDAGDSTCSVPITSSPSLSPTRNPSKEPTDSPSKVVSRLYIWYDNLTTHFSHSFSIYLHHL